MSLSLLPEKMLAQHGAAPQPERVSPPLPLSMRTIIQAACTLFGITEMDLVSPRRNGAIIEIRHILALVLHDMTRQSLPAIGRALWRDHTTILHSINVARERRARDAAFAARINGLVAALTALANRLQSSDAASEQGVKVISTPCKDAGHQVETQNLPEQHDRAVSELAQARRERNAAQNAHALAIVALDELEAQHAKTLNSLAITPDMLDAIKSLATIVPRLSRTINSRRDEEQYRADDASVHSLAIRLGTLAAAHFQTQRTKP